MSEPHEFGGPVNRPAHNARQISPGEALDGARTSGAGSDFLGLNEQLQPPAQPAPAAPEQHSWLLQHEEQPVGNLAPPSPSVADDPSAMPASAASLLNASWRETPSAGRRPRWVAPVAGGALLATLGLIGLPLLRNPPPSAPEPSSAPRTRTRVVEPAAPKPVASNSSASAAAAVEPVQADALLDRPDELASESARPARRSGDGRREAAPVNAPPPGASFGPPVEVFDPAGVWTVEGQGTEDEVDTTEGVDAEVHGEGLGADASASRSEAPAEAHAFVAIEAECRGEPVRRAPQTAGAALDWERLVWLSQDLDAAADASPARDADAAQAADHVAASSAGGGDSGRFDDGVARALAAWLGSEGVAPAPQPVQTSSNSEPIVGVCDEPPQVVDEAGVQETGVELALSDWGNASGGTQAPSIGAPESAAAATAQAEVSSPAPQGEVVDVRAPRREQNAEQLTHAGRRAALRDQLQRRRARQLSQAAKQEAELERAEASAPATAASSEPTSTEQAPTEQAPTEQAPTEQAPTEQAPTEQAPTEQAPIEQAPTEQAPTEQAPTPQVPVAQVPQPAAPSSTTDATPAETAKPAEEPESTREQRRRAQPNGGVPVVGPLPLQRRAGGRKPAAPQRVLQVATERDLANVWSGTEAPLSEAQRATRLATPNVGRARVVFRTGEIFEGDLVAVGEQRVWLRTKTGELGLDAARVGSVVRIAPGDTPTLGAAGSQKLAGLQRARVKTPGGMLTGRIIEQDAERTTLITDAGARIVLRSREVEVLGEKPAVQIRP